MFRKGMLHVADNKVGAMYNQMFLFDRFPGVAPAYLRVRRMLISKIEEGIWMPGMRLPSERELANATGVSVGTVRKSFDSLVRDGYVTRIQGKGSFVRSNILDRNFVKYYKMSRDLVGDDARLTLQCISVSEKKAPPRAVKHFGEHGAKNFLCIERLFFAADNTVKVPVVHSLSYIPMYLGKNMRTIPFHEIETRALYILIEKHCGVPALKSEELLTVENASAHSAKLLGIGKRDNIMVSAMLSTGYAGTPIEFRISYLRVNEFGLTRVHEFTR